MHKCGSFKNLLLKIQQKRKWESFGFSKTHDIFRPTGLEEES